MSDTPKTDALRNVADAATVGQRHFKVLGDAIDSHEQLERELSALRNDAERYRWLRGRISGGEYRRLGLNYGELSDVDGLIDNALLCAVL